MNKLLIGLLATFIWGCSTSSESNISESKTENIEEGSNWGDHIVYEIFVQSFYDSDGDSIGDIPGMTSKLDYLADLKIDAIWLMPTMPSPSYHKYDVTDYYGVHEDYGIMNDFEHFVTEAHKRNIKVIIDLVVNHTSSQHPWFLESSKSEQSDYRNFYVWADKDSIVEQLAKKETSFDSDNIRQWHPVNGDTTREHYYGFFWGGMPDLNFDNPQVREKIYEIGRFWLNEIGVDGFRLDAARHIYPDDRPEDNHAFWREFKAEMEKAKPDVYLVGEIWEDANTAAPYASGFTSFFNFDLAFSILESINRGTVVSATIEGHGWEIDEDASFIRQLISNRSIFEKENQDYLDAVFLSNHDQNRVLSVLKNDIKKAKLAASILFTLPGTPYIYYGEEIGMRGMKPDPRIREPFYWAADDEGNTSWLVPQHNSPDSTTSWKVQSEDENSIFNHYKEMISLRKSRPVLAYGDLQEHFVPNDHILSYIRSYEDDQVIVYHNLSNRPQEVSEQIEDSLILLGQGQVEIISNSFVLQPQSSLIVRN